MASVSVSALIDMLRRYRLLTTEQLAAAVRLSHRHPGDARLIAKTLVQQGWLTVYQMNQLLAAHGEDLVLGPYHILDRLGQGGQSQVFKARHCEHEWLVALKVIRTELLATSEAREQFLLEMEAMAELEHPNIVQFCDADQAGETYYCAMEYVEGTDLGKYVRLAGLLPPAQATDFVRQTALGLQHAHEHNLIHRDIKPVNLFLTTAMAPPRDPFAPAAAAAPPPSQLIKILDWGLACLRPTRSQPNGANNGTPTKAIIGTADYLSPEQARNADRADIRSDIYSLGCTLYYLLAGQPPFPSGTLMQKLIQHQRDEPPAIESINTEVPAGLSTILKRLMAKKPEDRYQTPAAVALALMSFARKGAPAAAVRREPRPAEAARIPDDTPMPTALKSGQASPRPAVPARSPIPVRTNDTRLP